MILLDASKKIKSTPKISNYNISPLEIPISKVLYSSHRAVTSYSPPVDIIGRKLNSDYVLTSNKEPEKKYPFTIYTIPSKIIRALSVKRISSRMRLKTKTENSKENVQPRIKKSPKKDPELAKSKSCGKLVKKGKKVSKKKSKIQGNRKSLRVCE